MTAFIVKKALNRLPNSMVKTLFNLWPPYLAAGIKVRRATPDFREIDVAMKLRWYNKNYVGTHFGGSIYAMTDPFYMFMLINILGRDYIVWDKAAQIRFRKPGKGKLTANYRLSDEEIQALYHENGW